MNPAYTAREAGGARCEGAGHRGVATVYIPQFIPRVGTDAPYMNIQSLIWLTYYVKYLARTQQGFEISSTTRDKLKRVYAQLRLEENSRKVASPPKLTSIEYIRECIDDIKACLEKKRGLERCPLVYVTHDKEWLDDALHTLPSCPFTSFDNKIVARAPLTGPMFKADNIKVWGVIRDMFHKTVQWSWVQPNQAKKDEGGAYKSIITYYLGDGAHGTTVNAANETLAKLFFDRHKMGLSFDAFCNRIYEAYNDINTYGPEMVVSNRTKVWHFSHRITSSALPVPISTVVANPTWTLKQAMNFVG